MAKKSDKEKTRVKTPRDGALPPLKKYSTSNISLLILCILLGIVLCIMFNMKWFLTVVTVDGFCKMCEILANYYLILVGGVLAMVRMRVLKRTSLKRIKFWEYYFATLFFIATIIISGVGTFSDGTLWRHVQFFGYALCAYFVSCWLGVDNRTPTTAQTNTPDTGDNQGTEDNNSTEEKSE